MKANNKRGQIYIEPKLAHVLDLMIKRMGSKRDVVLLVDGHEGEGKSNIATMICSYVAEKTGRSFSVDNCFFDIKDMTKFAKTGKEKIIWWDEGALGGLASDWWNKNQKLFVKLLMVARKKQHFFVICVPKFYKLNEYIACDRSIGLVHVYSADNLERGRFTYYNDAKKDILYDDWKRKHKKSYKYKYNFHGRFSDCLQYLIDEDAYEEKKDKAIEEIDKQEVPKVKLKMDGIRKRIALSDDLTEEKKAYLLGVVVSHVSNIKSQLKADETIPIDPKS